jgi:hypothetical protein
MNTNPDEPKISLQDILVWPDGSWCFRDELIEMAHRGDDYSVIPLDSPEWEKFLMES